MFYKKVIKIEQWGDTPLFYTNMVLGLFQSFFINILLKFYLIYTKKGEVIIFFKHYTLVFFAIGMLFYVLNRQYFKNKEQKILNEISKKPILNIFFIYIFVIIVLTTIAYFFLKSSILIRENNDRILGLE